MTVSNIPVIQTDFTRRLPQWQSASWEDYLTARDEQTNQRVRLFFHRGNLLAIDIGWERIDRANISHLFTMILGFWFAQPPEQIFNSIL